MNGLLLPVFTDTGRKVLSAICFVLGVTTSLCAYPAASDKVSSNGSGGVAFAVFSDSCRYITVQVNVDAQAVHVPSNRANSKSSAIGVVQIYYLNTCKNTVSFEYFIIQDLQFSAQDANGTQVPRSLTASGQGTSTDGTDFVSFQMSLTAISSAVFQKTDTSQTIFPNGTDKVKINEHSDYAIGSASSSLYVTTQQFGTLPVVNAGSYVYSARDHTIVVTK